MNYFVKRDNQEFGPYSLADLQRYVGSGNVLITDLARSEAMTEWVPVTSVIGTIPVPAAPMQHAYQPVQNDYPLPPGLHWALVLLLGVVTCGIFSYVWFYIQAAYVRQLVPKNRAMLWFSIGLALYVGAMIASVANGVSMAREHTAPLASLVLLLELAGAAFMITGNFTLRSGIEEHFNSAENIGLSLSGVMTFFFHIIYFQYHFTKIREARLQQGAYPVNA